MFGYEECEETRSLLEEGSFGEQQWQLANLGLSKKISLDESQSVFSMPSSNNYAQILPDQPASPASPPYPGPTQQPRRYPIDYQKNICAYITKKAVQCFLSFSYKRKIEKLCRKYGCQLSDVLGYYGHRNKEVFGITHLWLLVTPQDPDNEQEVAIKRVFAAFFQWFLRERYLVYLLRYGKMNEKEKYIEFKNKYLLNIENMSPQSLQSD